MKLTFIFIILLIAPFYVFAQNNNKIDTIIYKKQGEPYFLVPHWLVGKKDTFNLTEINTTVKNGDTILNKQLRSKIIHTVENINDSSIIQTAKIGKEIYQKLIFYNNKLPKNSLLKDFYSVKYQTNLDGTNIKILNCADVQKHLLIDLQIAIDSATISNDDNVYALKDYLKMMKECGNVQSFLMNDVEMFHQFFNQLVPIKDTLKYQVTIKDTINPERTIIAYYQVFLTKKLNGNKIFEFSEDKEKGATLFEQIAKGIENKLTEIDASKRPNNSDFKGTREEKTIIEVDRYNYPVAIKRLRIATKQTKKELKLDIRDYKIERIN